MYSRFLWVGRYIMTLLDIICKLIFNILIICVGMWIVYVIVMAILNTIGIINVWLYCYFYMYTININCNKYIKSSWLLYLGSV